MVQGDRLWRGIRGLCGIAALSFAIVGSLFFLVPDQVLATLEAAGSAFGDFASLPPGGARFWGALTAAYMAVVTALAALVWADPLRFAELLPALAVGKATSSLTTLWLYRTDRPAFAYLANFVVDGSIAVLALASFGALLWLRFCADQDLFPSAPDPFASPRARTAWHTFVSTMLPSHPDPDRLVLEFRDFLEGEHPAAPRLATWLVLGLDLAPRLVPGHLRSFTSMDPAARAGWLRACYQSPWLVVRQPVADLRFLFLTMAYGTQDLAREVGYPGPEPTGPREAS